MITRRITSIHVLASVIVLPLAVPMPRKWSHYAACAPVLTEATVIAPTLADSGRLFRAVPGRDDSELYFFKKVGSDPNAEDYRIYVSRLENDVWSAPERVNLGGEFSDLYPSARFPETLRPTRTRTSGLWIARRTDGKRRFRCSSPTGSAVTTPSRCFGETSWCSGARRQTGTRRSRS